MRQVSEATISLTDVTNASERAGISRRTLVQWIEKGVVQYSHDVEGKPMFTQAEMQELCDFASRRRGILTNWPLLARSQSAA